ncbi:MAG: phage holin family protein, partial [Desulfarculaceae bacterium]|jgi:putative membrane protein
MRGIFFRWLVSAGGLLLISYLLDGIRVDGLGWAFIAAIFLGLFNALIRPVLLVLTLPLNVLTLGLLTLVINGSMLWLTGKLLAGFHVQGFWSAVGGALILSLISLAVNYLTGGGRGHSEVIYMRKGSDGHWR